MINWNGYNVRKCMHKDAERYGDGEYCVYFWQDKYANVFYVGSGKGYRYNNIAARSFAFKKQLSAGGCEPKIVAYGMSKEESLDFEKRLIAAFWDLEFPLTNIRGVEEREQQLREEGRKRMMWLYHGYEYEDEMGIPRKNGSNA